MITAEYIRTDPETIDVFGLGTMRKGSKIICSEDFAVEFRNDSRFRIKGFKIEKGGDE